VQTSPIGTIQKNGKPTQQNHTAEQTADTALEEFWQSLRSVDCESTTTKRKQKLVTAARIKN